MKTITIYVNGMTIGTISDAALREKGEADAIVTSLIKSFLGRVERSYPFRDRKHEVVSLFPADPTHGKFMTAHSLMEK